MTDEAVLAESHSPARGTDGLENLAWKLAMVVNGTAEQKLLASYEGERRQVDGCRTRQPVGAGDARPIPARSTDG